MGRRGKKMMGREREIRGGKERKGEENIGRGKGIGS